MKFIIETDPLTLTKASTNKESLEREDSTQFWRPCQLRILLVYLWDNPWTRRYETENDQFTLLARDWLGSSATQFGKLPNPGANKLQLSSLASIEAVIWISVRPTARSAVVRDETEKLAKRNPTKSSFVLICSTQGTHWPSLHFATVAKRCATWGWREDAMIMNGWRTWFD